jgi:hypothetical protein
VNITKKEIMEVLQQVEDEEMVEITENCEVKLGQESDGDNVIVILTRVSNTKAIFSMSRRVRKLARSKGDDCLITVMWESWFDYYVRESGFEELNEKPLEFTFVQNEDKRRNAWGVLYVNGKYCTKVSMLRLEGVGWEGDV